MPKSRHNKTKRGTGKQRWQRHHEYLQKAAPKYWAYQADREFRYAMLMSQQDDEAAERIINEYRKIDEDSAAECVKQLAMLRRIAACYAAENRA